MSEMMEVAYQRQISDVTRDIRIQTGQFLRTAIEIGRLLFEAKAMVEPGGWTKYIEEELPFSHSWANNYMKLYKEFGSDQTSLFEDSQAFMNLRPTQALELLALPAGEREAFVQENDVENMSTRQLRQAIKDLEDTRKQLQEAEANLDDAVKTRAQVEQDLEEAEMRAADAERLAEKQKNQAEFDAREAKLAADAQRARAEAAEQARERAEKSESNALNLVEKLKKQLADARLAEESAREDLKKAKENPDVPESMMVQLRKEAEAEAAKKAAEGLQKKLDAAEKSAKEAARAKEAAEDAAREAQEKLAAVQKSGKLANPDVMSVNVLGQQMLSIWNTIQVHREKAIAADPANGKPIDGFLGMLLDSMRESIREEE